MPIKEVEDGLIPTCLVLLLDEPVIIISKDHILDGHLVSSHRLYDRVRLCQQQIVGGKRSAWVKRAPPTNILPSRFKVTSVNEWLVRLSSAA